MAHLVLSGVTATGSSGSIFLSERKSTHTVTCWFTNSNITALTIRLEGSDESRMVTDADAKWYNLHEPHQFTSYEISDKRAMFHITTISPVKRVRINISTLTGINVNTDTVSAKYEEGTT